ncbi:MAG: NYN domain-containing protein [Patescibacteria group bacterium]
MRVVDYQARFNNCWEALVAKQQEAGLTSIVNLNPVGVIKTHLSRGQACKFIEFILEKINPVKKSPPGRGRPSMATSILGFRLAQIEAPDFSELISKFGKKPIQNNGHDLSSELLKRFSSLEEKVTAQLAREKRCAIWIDSPNLSKSCEQMRCEMPIKQILDYFSIKAPISFGAAFYNIGCSVDILRAYTLHNITSVGCLYSKPSRIGQTDQRHASDPVDQEMIRNIRQLIDIADIHILVSGDRDFDPIIHFLRQQQKEVYRVFLNTMTRSAMVEYSDKRKVVIPGGLPKKEISRPVLHKLLNPPS